MDAEKLNQKLYARMSAEQEEYHSWLLGQKKDCWNPGRTSRSEHQKALYQGTVGSETRPRRPVY